MRTGIYVHRKTTVTIEATDDVEVSRYVVPLSAGRATLELEPGVYKIFSGKNTVVNGSDIDVFIMRDKDDPPDPPPVWTPTETATPAPVTRARVKSFFSEEGAKSLSLGGKTK